jgi:hypothetical protein
LLVSVACEYNQSLDGAVAQLGERLPCTEEVRGSNPLSSSSFELLLYFYLH